MADQSTLFPPDRREFLKTAGAVTAGAVAVRSLDGLAQVVPGAVQRAAATWAVRPFALSEKPPNSST